VALGFGKESKTVGDEPTGENPRDPPEVAGVAESSTASSGGSAAASSEFEATVADGDPVFLFSLAEVAAAGSYFLGCLKVIGERFQVSYVDPK